MWIKQKQRIHMKTLPSLGIAVLAIILALYLYQVIQYQKQVKAMTFQETEIKNVADGTYIGQCDVNFIYAKVQVRVEEGKITRIAILEHKNGRGKPAEQITENMIKEQQTDVDAITSATNSSKVIRIAVENALEQGA